LFNKISFQKLFILGISLLVIFTTLLIENIQFVDGFLSKSTAGWIYKLNPGESQVLKWTITNTEDKSIDIQFRGEGKGSELFVYEENVTFKPKEKKL
jgi:hypothetical protein